MRQSLTLILFFFFNDTATTEIYTLSLHDALPISPVNAWDSFGQLYFDTITHDTAALRYLRSEEHTSELQSQSNLVCRLLLEKKKKKRMQLIAMYKLLDDEVVEWI